MCEISNDLWRVVISNLTVTDCLRVEQAIQTKLYTKEQYLKRKEWEPLSNVIRLFKNNTFRTYRIYCYVKNGVTYSDVTVSPFCRFFRCEHTSLITPSVACHFILSCVTEGNTIGYGHITHYKNII